MSSEMNHASASASAGSGCSTCGAPNAYTDGGFTCMAMFDTPEEVKRICRECTRLAVMLWARETRRLTVPPPAPPTPTGPPVGDTTAPLLAARAA